MKVLVVVVDEVVVDGVAADRALRERGSGMHVVGVCMYVGSERWLAGSMH